MATKQATEGGIVMPPARTLEQIRVDMMKLDRELAHHTTYALYHKNRERADEIANSQVDLHLSAIALGRLIRQR